MKRLLTVGLVAVVTVAMLRPVQAGDREWATAGKILTGVIAGAALVHAFSPPPAPCVPTPPPVVYVPPSVTVVQPAPVMVMPPNPVLVVLPGPVLYAPAPGMVGPPLVCPRPVPGIGIHVGFHPRPRPRCG